MSRNSLLEPGAIYKVYVTASGLQQSQTVKLLETTEINCFFYRRLSIYKKLKLGLDLAYFRFNTGNYFGDTNVCLTTSIWMD